MKEIIVDNFAGGGGASTGIELATGRSVDIAINHDPAAILMHKTNHPTTEHYCESVWEVDPVKAVRGRPVALAWFSPDCKRFSKAKGGKPVDKTIRGLAWIVLKWAGKVRPRVIMLENVEEFVTWGPIRKGRPIKSRKGETFLKWKEQLESLGYVVEHRELKACDYGAPTTRKRFFLIARCDGKSIVWPEPTHGDPKGLEVRCGLLKPWRISGECIDWSIPIQSIFDRKTPLKENTLIRIARGLKKFVIEADEPYILDDKAMFLQHYYTHQGDETRGSSLNEPIATIPTANRFGLICAFISKYYGTEHSRSIASNLNEPLHTITTKHRFGLVTIKGEEYQIVDIAMRMLEAHELFKAQGFPEEYIIDRDYTGKKYPKIQQVARCGNAVPPPFAEHLVRANLPELCVGAEDERQIG